jgi:hypothetical protein
MARIKMVIGSNEFEAEGDEDFLKGLYEDFKTALMANKRLTDLVNTETGPKQITAPNGEVPADDNSPKAAKPQQEKRKKRIKSIAADRRLNLRPEGKQAFADFIGVMQPASNNERNVVSVYYLTEVLGQPSVSLAQIVSCYDDRDWRIPADVKNSLQQTASVQGWINTENSDEIVLEVKGRNHVKHDMPSTKAAS